MLNGVQNISFGKIKAKKHIVQHPNSPVSPEFIREMSEGIESLGTVGEKVIKKEKLKFHLAQKTSGAFPELKYTHPRGWSTGKTYDNVPALSSPKGIGLFEKPINQRKAGISDIRHEVGHKLHRMFNKIIGCEFIDTQGFTDVYLKDMQNFSEKLKKYGKKVKDADFYMNYLVQESTRTNATKVGKREAFTEICAKLYGGSVLETYSKGMDKLIDKCFPNTVEYVKKFLWLMGKR